MGRYAIEPSEAERSELARIATKGKGPVADARRASVLLAVDKGAFADLRWTDARAAEACRFTEQTVRNLKKRCCEEGPLAAVGRKPRPRPGNVKLDGEAEAKIVALTCTDPPEGHARWTLRLIAEKSVELGYVDSISRVAVGDMLKKTTSSHGWSGSGASPRRPASS